MSANSLDVGRGNPTGCWLGQRSWMLLGVLKLARRGMPSPWGPFRRHGGFTPRRRRESVGRAGLKLRGV